MNICLYTNKECEKAREDGECRIGYQNCGWENWEIKDDQDYNETDEQDYD